MRRREEASMLITISAGISRIRAGFVGVVTA